MRISITNALVTLVLLCVGAAAPAGAQTSGVLLGIRRSGINESTDTARYETLWIVNSHEAPLRATLPELLVPRANGFWRVGVAPTCGGGEDDAHIDRLWMVPADRRPSLGAPCPTVLASDIPGYSMMLDSAQQAGMDTLQVMCEIDGVEIFFLTGESIGTFDTNRQTESCEPRGGRYGYGPRMIRFSSDTLIDLRDAAGRDPDSAFARAAQRAVRTASTEECGFLLGGPQERASAAQEIDAWYVDRWQGRWRPSVFHHVFGSECSYDAPILLTLSPRFTGHDALRPTWPVIARKVPGAVDAVSSPNGDLVVAFTSDSLIAFAGNGTTLGARLLAMSFKRERIVMVQWATGRNVARWTTELARLAPLLQPPEIATSSP